MNNSPKNKNSVIIYCHYSVIDLHHAIPNSYAAIFSVVDKK